MFRKVKIERVYQKVIEQIGEMIKNGYLKKGDKLPPERELVEQLGVSRTSIREALRVLEILGVIESRQGEGNFITNHLDDIFFQPLSLIFMLRNNDPVEILEMRKILDVGVAGLAAQRITDDDLKKLKEIIEKFKISDDENINTSLDKEFHYIIIGASGNFLAKDIYNTISMLFYQFIAGARKQIMQDKGNQAILLAQHEEIYRAMEKHDPKLAEEAMIRHLDFVTGFYLAP
jgi:GntR family transcriptional repressor for pyruvate dehydrogenase complex